MFRNVLVPIDLNHSESWEKALPLAVEMAQATGGRIHVTTVVPDFGAAMVKGYFPEGFEENALAHAKDEMAKVVSGAVPDDVVCELHLEHGSIRSHILARAEEVGADLILMASHAPDQVREFFVGSHADWIARHSPISVLVLRSTD